MVLLYLERENVPVVLNHIYECAASRTSPSKRQRSSGLLDVYDSFFVACLCCSLLAYIFAVKGLECVVSERRNSGRSYILLVAQSNLVQRQHLQRQEDPCRLPVHQCRAQKRESRSVIHGRIGDIEGKRGYPMIHQDAKVVAQIRASDAQSPHAAKDEDVARGNQTVAEIGRRWRHEQIVGRLRSERTFIPIRLAIELCG